MSKMAVMALVAVLMLTMACVAQYPDDIETPESPSRLVRSVQRAWNENPIRFIEQHQGDLVEVKGTVKEISTDASVTIQNSMSGSSKSVICWMTHGDAAMVSKYDTVRVSGRILRSEIELAHTGRLDRRVVLDDCELLEHSEYRRKW